MFYQSIYISKQAVHQLLNRKIRLYEEEGYLISLIDQIRKDHPTLSCRAMYYMLKPRTMGRDRFESFCKSAGFYVDRKSNFLRTTNSNGVIRFENLLEGTELTGINQAFSSDITYFEIEGVFYYLTFVIDCYSRRILGHSVSKGLSTSQTTLPALKMAIRTRGQLPEGLIFHSDGGGQYYAKEFLSYTTKHKIRNSMCEYAYENGKAERVNGTIKNNYLKFYHINGFIELVKKVDRSVKLYNTKRPHKSLKYLAPIDYEKEILYLKEQTKPMMKESLEANTKVLRDIGSPKTLANHTSESRCIECK